MPQLGGHLRGLLRGVLAGDADQDKQTGLIDRSHHPPIDGHTGLADPLDHGTHRITPLVGSRVPASGIPASGHWPPW